MQPAIFIFSFLAAVTGFAAAWYWFYSARVAYPSILHGDTLYGGTVVNANPLLQAVQKSARLNMVAAILTGVAALFAGVAAFLNAVAGGMYFLFS